MKRLREQPETSDPVVACAVELLSAAKPLEPSPTRQARVRAALDATYRSPRRRQLLLKPIVALVGLLVFVSVASAMLGGWIEHRRMQRQAAPPSPVSSSTATAPRPRVEPSTGASKPIGADTTAAPAPLAAPSGRAATKTHSPAVADEPPPPPSVSEATSPEEPQAVAAPAEGSVSVEEVTLVADAIRVLRHENDAPRAGRLLEDYLRRYPQGALAEEALAVAIEAAMASGDKSAGALAGEYLKKYPSGRFRQIAKNAQSRAP